VTLTTDGRVATKEGPEAGAFALLWADGTLLAVGNTADAPSVRIRDGEGWSEGGPLPSGAGAIAAGIVHRNGQFVIVGSGPSGALAWHSPDGRTWTVEASLPEAGGALIRDATGDATGLLAIGARGTLPVLWHASIESKELP
jgi:hypothetical protein